ncbi:MAG: hypothetical protein U1E27_13145 [Kiritimatiellia bacterium]|nr:hypothetical protein [Kiritimatiellia bacterium]
MSHPSKPRRALVWTGDPAFDRKREALAFFDHDVTASDSPRPVELADVSASDDPALARAFASQAEIVLVSPAVGSALAASGPLASPYIETYPLRAWGIVQKVKAYRAASIPGEMTSLRLFWEQPPSRAVKKPPFVDRLAEFLDLAEYLAGVPVVSVQMEAAAGGNAVFGLVTLEGNIVAELNVNDRLPESLAPVRFLHVYFSHGVVSNMPLYGYENDEGALFADDRTARHEVYEHMDWPGTEEADNFYLGWLGMILGGERTGFGSGRFIRYRRAVEEAMRTGESVSLGEGS